MPKHRFSRLIACTHDHISSSAKLLQVLVILVNISDKHSRSFKNYGVYLYLGGKKNK